MNKIRKTVYFLFTAFLAVLVLFCSCSKTDKSVPETAVTADRNALKTEIGTGRISFYFEVTDEKSTLKSFLIHTDETNLYNALNSYGLIKTQVINEGETVKNIDGITAYSDENKTHWAFFINGKKSSTVCEKTVIEEGSIYSFVFTKN
ncbi:MAG: hypothetical protein K6B52_09720 [Clostridiales bacterium]|nr:hypothetical protein [Clostridiales bacterium]